MIKSKNTISAFLVLISIISFISFETRAESELKENSWRYKDGVPIEVPDEFLNDDFDIQL